VDRKVKKQQVLQAVLAEQNKQRLANIHDPEAIAEVGRKHSRPTKELAFKLGLLDANFANNDSWIERAKKQWEKLIPSKFRPLPPSSCNADFDQLRYASFSGNVLYEGGAVKVAVQ
jgi:hypothetical protein